MINTGSIDFATSTKFQTILSNAEIVIPTENLIPPTNKAHYLATNVSQVDATKIWFQEPMPLLHFVTNATSCKMEILDPKMCDSTQIPIGDSSADPTISGLNFTH